MQRLLLTITILLVQTSSHLTDRTIDTLNLLLPLSPEIHTSYPLAASNGCYQWTSSNPNIISLTPHKTGSQHNTDCFNSATAKVETSTAFGGAVWLMAKDRLTGHLLKCEARVAHINRLGILTRLRTIYVEDFETLEVVGYDKEGNVFNSLEGFRFFWEVEQEGKLAEFWGFGESGVKTTELRRQIEETGGKSDQVVLKGMKTGKVKVSAKVDDRVYKGKETSVVVHIIEHFVVVPEGDLFVLPCSSVDFRVYIIRAKGQKASINKVSLPNGNYKFEADKQFKGQISQNGKLLIGDERGRFALKVIDMKKEDNVITKMVSVVNPVKLVIQITKIDGERRKQLRNKEFDYFDNFIDDTKNFDNNWNLLKGESYLVKPVLFGTDYSVIYSDELDFLWGVDTDVFEIFYTKQNSLVLQPKKDALKTEITVSLDDLKCIDTTLKDKKGVFISSRVSLLKPVSEQLLLPEKGEFNLKCIGGSGNYIWETTDPTLLILNQSGEIKAVKEGETLVYCIDKLNPENRDVITIEIAKPKQLRAIERKKELMETVEDNLLVGLTNSEGVLFSNCTDTNIDFVIDKGEIKVDKREYDLNTINKETFKLKDNVFLEDESKHSQYHIMTYRKHIDNGDITEKDLNDLINKLSNFGICGVFAVSSEVKGQSAVSFSHPDYGIDSSKIQTYRPFKVNPVTELDKEVYGEDVLLLPYTSMNYTVKEGPKVWPNAKKLSHRTYNLSQSKTIFSGDIKGNGEFLEFSLNCVNDNFGETEQGSFELISRNQANKDLIRPLSVRTTVSGLCSHPSSIKIQEKGRLNKGKELSLRNNKKHDLDILVLNNDGVAFWNRNSLNVHWELDGNNHGKLSGRNGIQNQLELDEIIGSMTLTAKSDNYLQSGNQTKFSEVKDVITIHSVNKLTLEPQRLVLLLHEDNVEKIKIFNGSGKFSVNSSNKKIVDLHFNENNREIIVKPLQKGETVVYVTDDYLSSTTALECHITVVALTRLELSIEKSLIQINEKSLLNIKAFANNLEITQRQLSLIPLKLKPSEKELITEDSPFSVQSKTKGNYMVIVESVDFSISSNAVFVDVFEPIMIFPDQLILAPGCVGYFNIQGGPNQLQRQKNNYRIKLKLPSSISTVEQVEDTLYSISTGNNKSGIIVAELTDKEGKTISESKVIVLFERIEELHINGNNKLIKETSSRILVVPKTASGYLSLAFCPIKYTVEHSNPDIVGLNNYQSDRAQNFNSSLFRFNISGKNIGSSLFTVKMTFKDKITKTAKFNISVVDNLIVPTALGLQSNLCNNGPLLMSVNSFYDIPNVSADVKSELSQLDKAVVLTSIARLESGTKLGNDILILKHGQNIGTTTVSVGKPVTLVLSSHDQTGFMQTNFDATFRLQALDSFGRLFVSLPTDAHFDFLISDPSVISYKFNRRMNELYVKSHKEGKSLMHVRSRRYPELVEALEFNVGPLMTPSGEMTLPLGSKFTARLINISDFSQLESSDENIISIDSKGTVTALKEGKADLRVKGSDILTARLEVIKITHLYPFRKNPTAITNVETLSIYKDSYLFLFKPGSLDREIGIPSDIHIDKKHSVNCVVNSDDLFVKSINSYQNEYVGCEIVFERNKVVKNKKVNLRVVLKNNMDDSEIFTNITLDVLNRFKIPDNRKIIQLNKNSNTSEINIASDEKLKTDVSSNLSQYVKTLYIHETGIFKMLVQIPNDYPKRIKAQITLENVVTRQKEVILFEFDPSSSFWSWFNLSTENSLSMSDGIIIILCVFVLGVIIRELRKKRDGNDFTDVSISQNIISNSLPHRTRRDHYDSNLSRMMRTSMYD